MSVFFSLLRPQIAEASVVGTLILKINKYVVNPLILLMFAIAILMFTVGIFEYLAQKDNPDATQKGKNHMLWGIIGMFIMVAAFGIMRLIINTLGIELPADATLPNP